MCQYTSESPPGRGAFGSDVSIVIPAYQPAAGLTDVVEGLKDLGAGKIIIVDDGSRADCSPRFAALAKTPGVYVLRHAVNLGKGAALKTGINFALCQFPHDVGVVTADADGQHAPRDILTVAAELLKQGTSVVLGARRFDPDVPLRSRLGNRVTVRLFSALVGQRLSDTQTGLRGIPELLLPRLLSIASSGYEFELDMLILAKHLGCRIVEVPIQTIYQHGNKQSHFNPLTDSVRIYFVLLRFSAVSLMTALLDNIAFSVAIWQGASVAGAQIAARVCAVLFNYSAARRAVFLTKTAHRIVFPKYLGLVIASGMASFGLIRFFHEGFAMPVLTAKVLAETILFVANFAVQRDFVFRQSDDMGTKTDWDAYYKKPALTAHLTRRYTNRVLLNVLRRSVPPNARNALAITELGGANSCFIQSILRHIRPASYEVVDTNSWGLDLLRQRLGGDRRLVLVQQDVLELDGGGKADVVFSVGLIEHFNVEDTRRAIKAHFDVARPGGYVVISYPTPTWLYRVTRRLLEELKLWKFPDERPLEAAEVTSSLQETGEILYAKTLWPLVLTQRMIVARKTQPRGA